MVNVTFLWAKQCGSGTTHREHSADYAPAYPTTGDIGNRKGFTITTEIGDTEGEGVTVVEVQIPECSQGGRWLPERWDVVDGECRMAPYVRDGRTPTPTRSPLECTRRPSVLRFIHKTIIAVPRGVGSQDHVVQMAEGSGSQDVGSPEFSVSKPDVLQVWPLCCE